MDGGRLRILQFVVVSGWMSKVKDGSENSDGWTYGEDG